MKQGKKPNKAQKQIINAAGLDSAEWLVVKNLEYNMEIIHRDGTKGKTIIK